MNTKRYWVKWSISMIVSGGVGVTTIIAGKALNIGFISIVLAFIFMVATVNVFQKWVEN